MSAFLYEGIARNIKSNIETGLLRTGEKLTSVRLLSSELGVSSATVFRAYLELEAEGLIESRPKSGYYVRYKPAERLKPLRKKSITPSVRLITNQDIIREVIHKPNGSGVIDLSAAVPSPALLPLAKIKKSIQRSYLNDALVATRYEESGGNLSLRRYIAQFALNWGKAYREEDILITSGCLEALSLSLRTLTQPGDTVAIESPTYYGLLQLLEGLRLKVIELPADPAIGVSPNQIKKVIQKHAIKALLLIPNFNNPLGSCIPDTHKEQIVAIASESKVPIIEDDIYGELYYGNSRPKNCKTYDEAGWVIYCSSFSKTLVPGFRIGWCIPGRFTEALLKEKFISNIATSSLPQAALMHFLQNGRYELHLKKLRQSLHLQHRQYREAMEEYFPAYVRLTYPQGGYVNWIELPSESNALHLYRKAAAKGIKIAPGQIFSAQADYKNYFRISHGAPYNEAIAHGLKTLGVMIRS